MPTLVNLIVNLTEESSPMISELDVITGFTDIVLGVNPVMEIPETLANDGFDVVPTIAEMDESTVVEYGVRKLLTVTTQILDDPLETEILMVTALVVAVHEVIEIVVNADDYIK